MCTYVCRADGTSVSLRWTPIGGKGDTLYYFGSGDTRPRILLGGAPNRRCSTAAHDACLLPVTRVSEQFVPLHLRVSHFLSVCLTGCAFDTFVRLYPSSDPHTVHVAICGGGPRGGRSLLWRYSWGPNKINYQSLCARPAPSRLFSAQTDDCVYWLLLTVRLVQLDCTSYLGRQYHLY